ncbi:unnamed protein product [Adineta steineri]|uniref:Fibronectin type-III domain-containing protein n=1 Tax=Adineta steineri TaxID=433720 RepID=A0A814TWA1_9BILA|nr:unnamed protein product [Adineta steineri]
MLLKNVIKKSGDWVRCAETVNGTQVIIEKLEEGHEYEFRIMAENTNGLSESLVTEKAVLVKNPFNKMFLFYSIAQPVEWTPPRNDGGNPVKGYIVKRRDKVAKKECTKTNRGELHKGTNLFHENIKVMKEYEYRVSAINGAGPGESSSSSGGIATGSKKGISTLNILLIVFTFCKHETNKQSAS